MSEKQKPRRGQEYYPVNRGFGPPEVVCLGCGAVVADRITHDRWHWHIYDSTVHGGLQ